MKIGGAVYIVTNKHNTVLYTGVTSNLMRRMNQHRNGFHPNSFTKRYNLYKLVYYEIIWGMDAAIAREKQIKAGSRRKKIELIESTNPNWDDLYDGLSPTRPLI